MQPHKYEVMQPRFNSKHKHTRRPKHNTCAPPLSKEQHRARRRERKASSARALKLKAVPPTPAEPQRHSKISRMNATTKLQLKAFMEVAGQVQSARYRQLTGHAAPAQLAPKGFAAANGLLFRFNS